MGFRFRRRLGIFPGIYMNIGKRGVSTSIGGRGASLNVSDKGTRTTVGIPGSGLSYRSPLRPWTARGAGNPTSSSEGWGHSIALSLLMLAIVAITMALRLGG